MSLRQLETLIAITETGGFGAAAMRLGVTQSAVSMQIKALEAELGVVLFDRAHRPPVPTEQARDLLDRAREIVGLYGALKSAARAGGEVAGTLRLGVIPTVSTGILPDALALLRAWYPALSVRIENGLSTELPPRVERGELDAAIMTEPGSLPRGIAGRLIMTERLMVVAPAGTPSAGHADLLRAQPFVRFNRRAGVGRIIDVALRREGIQVTELMELDSIESILAMVRRGLGVAVAPERSLTPEIRRELVCRPFGDPPVSRRVSLIEPARDTRAPLTHALLDTLREAVGQNRTTRS